MRVCLTYLHPACLISGFSAFCRLSLSTWNPRGKETTPGLCNQAASLRKCSDLFEGAEANANAVTYSNSGNLIFHRGISAGCTGGPEGSHLLNFAKAAGAVIPNRWGNKANAPPYLSFSRNPTGSVGNLAVWWQKAAQNSKLSIGGKWHGEQ